MRVSIERGTVLDPRDPPAQGLTSARARVDMASRPARWARRVGAGLVVFKQRVCVVSVRDARGAALLGVVK